MMGPMEAVERVLAPEFTIHLLPAQDLRTRFLDENGARIRGIVAYSGAANVDRALLARLPAVAIIANMGVGYDSVDLEAATERGIVVTNSGSVNARDVAEHAFGLILATGRRIAAGDRYVREGRWRSEGRMPLTRRVTGRKLGILGLGHIGLCIAVRAAAFDMEISYHNRRRRDDVPYRYFAELIAMAGAVDFLVAACPGGEATRHLIDGAVIDALGPDGTLINIGRGSVVDEPALVAALVEGRLGGAGLDVFEDEPDVPAPLARMPNVVLQPHVAGATFEGIAASVDMVLRNLQACFAGRDVLSEVALPAAHARNQSGMKRG